MISFHLLYVFVKIVSYIYDYNIYNRLDAEISTKDYDSLSKEVDQLKKIVDKL